MSSSLVDGLLGAVLIVESSRTIEVELFTEEAAQRCHSVLYGFERSYPTEVTA